ncbi:MAG: hypothetical protein WCR52_00180 [Bacteroidota bacterium]
MKKLFYSITLLIGSLNQLSAQDVVFKMDPAVDTTEDKSGPNLKNYWHPYISFGMCIDPGSAGATVKQPHLDQFSFGFRYKNRLAEHLAVGLDISYNVNDYSLKQNASKTLPDTVQYKKQGMIFYNAQVGAYIRFNFGKRGNTLGNYLDLGAYGDYVVSHVQFTKFNLPDGSIVRARRTQLDYYQKINYGLLARIGFKKLVIYGQYRLSDMFYPSLKMAELPRIQAGIQFILR